MYYTGIRLTNKRHHTAVLIQAKGMTVQCIRIVSPPGLVCNSDRHKEEPERLHNAGYTLHCHTLCLP